MLILIAVVIAIVAIAATRLMDTAQDSSKTVEQQSDTMLKTSEKAMKAKSGEFCVIDENCESNSCNPVTDECN
jgi:type II secretory pathway pseudopilin PulG